jgi:DNA-binding CsgD family transcriptional regulator
MGKTTLLDALADSAADFRVVRASGAAAERALGYAGLGVLLRPLLPHADDLPPRQRRALSHCLAEDGGPVDLLALGSAVLSLMVEAAVERPVLVVVDDVHWFDAESRRALGFALRRLDRERVAVAVSSRTTADLPDGIADRVVLSPLDDDAALQVLHHRRPDLDDAQLRRHVELAEGNPLALVELAAADVHRASLSSEDTDRSLVGLFAPRIASLSPGAREAMLLAVLDGRIDPAVVLAALTQPKGQAEVDECVDVGLLQAEGQRLRLRHPVVASAVLATSRPAETRRAHARLADVLATTDPTRALWHRAHAAEGADAALGADMAAWGRRAWASGRPDEASHAFELAASLTLDAEQQAAYWLDAAESAFAQGSSERTRAQIARARERPLAVSSAGRARLLEARLDLGRGWQRAIGDSALTVVDDLPADDRSSTVVELVLMALEGHDADFARRAVRGRPTISREHPVITALVEALAQQQTAEPPEGGEAVDEIRRLVTSESRDLRTLLVMSTAAFDAGAPSRGRELLLQAEELARGSGDVDRLTSVLTGLAFADVQVGSWTSAVSRARAAIDLLDTDTSPERLVEALLLCAEIDAARGHEQQCRATCRRARHASGQLAQPWGFVMADRREGLLDLGLGNLSRAAASLESARSTASLHHMSDPYTSASPDLVETYLRLDRREDAIAAGKEFLATEAPSWPAPPRARALRVRGLLDPDDYDAAFDASVELDLGAGLTFAAARTLLLHGERLRRDGRRIDARRRLVQALDIFRRLEADPWTTRTEQELSASGVSASPPSTESVSQLLTPQELQVAALVAEGRRNREIADTLFLSPRTVESHLGRIFRKLGVTTRTQLALRINR